MNLDYVQNVYCINQCMNSPDISIVLLHELDLDNFKNKYKQHQQIEKKQLKFQKTINIIIFNLTQFNTVYIKDLTNYKNLS